MPWILNDNQFAACLKLAAAKRYEYAVKKIADSSEAWGLKNADGWVVVADDTGREMIPLWPHSRYAEACAIDTWSDCMPTSIDVHKVLDDWIPGSEERGLSFAVFPIPSGPGIPVEGAMLEENLREELAKYE